MPFEWPFPTLNSRLQNLELAFTPIVATELDKLLAHTPELRSCKLSYGSGQRDCDWDANAIFRTLELRCGQKLKDLSVTAETLHGMIKGGLHTFTCFPRLEHLELDVRMLIGPPVTDDLRYMSPSAFRDHEYSVGWNATAIPKLTEMLPSTIETVCLLTGHYGMETEILHSLFDGWHISNLQDLPHLDHVDVLRGFETIGWVEVTPGQTKESWNRAQEVVEAAGCFYDDSNSIWPLWVEQYYT
jgi:hypothetical protein